MPAAKSNASSLASSPKRLKAFIASLSDEEALALLYEWRFWARPEQLAPSDDDWLTWLLMAGRGFGKTRTGAETVREWAETGTASRIALIGPTAGDVRDVMIEGESGLLAISAPWCRPSYEPSKRRLTWPNGAIATAYSADEPERLRGPQHDAGWCDEVAAWRYPEAWDMYQFGLRLGNRPRTVVTTTPRAIKLVRDLLELPNLVVTRGTTRDNVSNLAKPFLDAITRRYEGTRLGRQELDGELLDDIPGSLWTRAVLDQARLRHDANIPNMQRIVVAVDPSGTRGGEDAGDSIGIVVAGKGIDGRAYVLADRTCNLSPAGWGAVVARAYHEFGADRVVAERNFGGAMVEHVIRTADPKIAYREVTASRGKVVRAEPVAALYEQKRVSHCGALALLEDQMCAMTPDGFLADGSPDRVDALVWAMTELMLNKAAPVAMSMPMRG